MALESAIGAEPLSEVCLPYWCASAHGHAGRGLREGTSRWRWVAEDQKRLKLGRRPPPQMSVEKSLELMPLESWHSCAKKAEGRCLVEFSCFGSSLVVR